MHPGRHRGSAAAGHAACPAYSDRRLGHDRLAGSEPTRPALPAKSRTSKLGSLPGWSQAGGKMGPLRLLPASRSCRSAVAAAPQAPGRVPVSRLPTSCGQDIHTHACTHRRRLAVRRQLALLVRACKQPGRCCDGTPRQHTQMWQADGAQCSIARQHGSRTHRQVCQPGAAAELLIRQSACQQSALQGSADRRTAVGEKEMCCVGSSQVAMRGGAAAVLELFAAV